MILTFWIKLSEQEAECCAGQLGTGFSFGQEEGPNAKSLCPLPKTYKARASSFDGILLGIVRRSSGFKRLPHSCKREIMGWASLSVAMRYIHPTDERVLECHFAVGWAQFREQ